MDNGLIEHFERILAALFRDLLQRTVHDALGDRLLAGGHQYVDELGNILIAELRIRQDFAFGDFSTTWHINYLRLYLTSSVTNF